MAVRRRLVAGDDSPASLIGVILVPTALMLLAFAGVAVAAMMDVGLRESIAENSSCNRSDCSADEIMVFAPITALSMFSIGALLLFISLAGPAGRLYNRLRGGRKEEESALGTLSSPASATSAPPSTSPWPSSSTIRTGPPPAPSPAAGGGDVLERLERLNALRRSGAITQAEFEAQKAKLLGGG